MQLTRMLPSNGQNWPFLITITVFLLSFMATSVTSLACNGCVDLDELNFDKTINRFPYSLVKFDIAFPYGEKHDAFAQFARAAHKVTDDLLVATVGIKDYGEMENKVLGQRFKVDDKNFPGIILFKGSVDDYLPLPTHTDISEENLKKFVTKHTELYIGCEGCLKEYQILTKNYANLDNADQLELIKKAESLMETLTTDEAKWSAKFYLIFMRKINEVGYKFVEEEMRRLLRLKAGKVTEAKRLELTKKLNILEGFYVNKLTKEEL